MNIDPIFFTLYVLNLDKSNEINAKENEEEIKGCEIYINEKKINFNYYYTFPCKGIYIIKYIFKKSLASTNFLFYDCKSLLFLDLSNFNSQNITNMGYMFYECKSIKSLDLSNLNTRNVTNMISMVSDCNSLISLDLSNFNTQNTNDMGFMFFGCNSLI